MTGNEHLGKKWLKENMGEKWQKTEPGGEKFIKVAMLHK